MAIKLTEQQMKTLSECLGARKIDTGSRLFRKVDGSPTVKYWLTIHLDDGRTLYVFRSGRWSETNPHTLKHNLVDEEAVS